jgi:hypothetical protein
LGLIEVIKGKRHDGHFGKDFIKVNYNVTPSEGSVRKQAKNGVMPQCTENSTPSYNGVMPQCTETPLVGNQYTNTLKKVTITNTEKIDGVLSSQNEKITPTMFDKFWATYPKQVDKGKTLTAWNKLCAKDDRPTWRIIRLAINRQKKTARWQNHQYIPNPSTWINESRWLDDPKDMIVYSRDSSEKGFKCPSGFTFGEDFGEYHGCSDCEDYEPKTYHRCRQANRLLQKNSN